MLWLDQGQGEEAARRNRPPIMVRTMPTNVADVAKRPGVAQRKLARLPTRRPTRKPGQSCGALPESTTVSLNLPRSNLSIRKLDEKIRSVAAPCHLVRPYPAAISSSLLLIPGERGEKREKGGAAVLRPFAMGWYDSYDVRRRSPVPPNTPGTLGPG